MVQSCRNERPASTMKIPWTIAIQFSLPLFFYSENSNAFGESENWVDSLFGHISDNVKAHEVVLISDFANPPILNPSINELLFEIVKNFATIRINIGGTKTVYEKAVNDSAADKSSMFFVLVHEMLSTNIASLENMVDVVRKISAYKDRPQMLLVIDTNCTDEDCEELFNYVWKRQMLDFTIIELVDNDQTSRIKVCRQNVSPVIRQMDPFKKEYTKSSWNASTKWFPDKALDMHGYELKAAVRHNPPFAMMTKDQEKLYARGATVSLLEVIAHELNFSIKFVDFTLPKCSGETEFCLFDLMRSGRFDILCHLVVHLTDNIEYQGLRTETVQLIKLCPVVPTMYKVKLPFPTKFFHAYALLFAIVMIFRLVSYLLKFRDGPWHLFPLAKVLFGISSKKMPKKIPERTLFTCLLFVSALCLSTIYTAVTSISLQTNFEIEIKTFEDLDASGLTPMIHKLVYNKTFGYNDESLKNLKEKVVFGSSRECLPLVSRQKNVTCLMIDDEAKVLINWYNRRSKRAEVKISEPCFWSDSVSFPLAEGSPYGFYFNSIIGRLNDAGLISWIYDSQHLESFTDTQSNSEPSPLDKRHNMVTLRQQLMAITIIGFTLSVIVFIAEIAFFRVVNCVLR